MNKIVILANSVRTTVRFRGSLIKMLVAEGHKVTVVAPCETNSDKDDLARLGAENFPIRKLHRPNTNPLRELHFLNELIGVLKKLEPNQIYACGLKSIVWGAIAASRIGVGRIVGLLEGMGTTFSIPDGGVAAKLQQKLNQKLVLKLLKHAFTRLDALIVLNKMDHQKISHTAGSNICPLHLMDGIGVDLNEYEMSPPTLNPVRFTIAARMIKEKGIYEFLEAASRIREKRPDVLFRVLGGIDEDANSVPEETLHRLHSNNVIEWKNYIPDIRDDLRETSVFVLPTKYSEGRPRSTMEAMSMGKPIITTDMPGAVDSISDTKSGYIVAAGDIDALIHSCLSFVNNPTSITKMGLHARHEAELRYDVTTKDKFQRDLILST